MEDVTYFHITCTILLLFVPKKIAETVSIHAVQLIVFIFSVKWESNF